MLNMPFTMADATTLTAAGYVGEDMENIIQKLLQKVTAITVGGPTSAKPWTIALNADQAPRRLAPVD